jgi:hypothetical protein
MARQRFAKGLGGTLRFTPPEARVSGAPSSGTVTLKTSLGGDFPPPVVNAQAAIDGNDLTYALVPENMPEPVTRGALDPLSLAPVSAALKPYYVLHRAIWTYVIGGVTYFADQVFEINRRVLKPTLAPDDVERRLPAAWEDLLEEGADIEEFIADGWSDLLDDLSAKGFLPDRILDSARLERPHRSKVIANLYRLFGPDWRETADKADEQYARDLDAALAALDWYEIIDDGIRASSESDATRAVRLTR